MRFSCAVFTLVLPLALAVRVAAAAPPPACGNPAKVIGEFAPQGVNVSLLDKTIAPGDDFFAHVNGGWVSATSIPEGHWDYGQTTALIGTVEQQTRTLLDDAVRTRGPRGSVERQVADAYASFLGAGAVDAHGATRLRSELAKLMRARTPEELARWMAHTTSSSLFAINVFPSERQWRVHLDQQNLAQAMLGLPNPDDYARSDAPAVSMREAYVAYVANVLGQAGIDRSRDRAERLLALETRIAANLWPFDKLRDRKANHHPMTVTELVEYAPGFPWRTFLRARGVSSVTDIVLGTDTAVREQSKLFAATSPDDWRTYLAFHWIQNQIDVLPGQFQAASWEFYGARLANAKLRPTGKEVAARLVNSAMGLQMGKLYSQRYVPDATRVAAEEMVGYLRKAFAERLAQTSWMDEETRAAAQAKLANLASKVGYPKIWPDFSRTHIRRDDPAGNLQRLRDAEWRAQLRRLEPGSAEEVWYQTPQTVDASYSVLFNAIELPGAFLQPPYFDANADAAVNFGAIGAIVGHEMGHGFDDQGIIYDAEGRMRNWWSEAALAEFHRRAEGLAVQYDAFAPYPDVHVDGRRTIGENIADLSGVLLAHRAYQLYLADHPCAQSQSLDGLTGEQRFFMAWAQAWRYKAPESAIRHVVKYGFHSPTQYRVNGVMQNIDAWYDAFGVGPHEKMYVPPERRVRIW